jgi:uncharacterized membrane protein
MGYFNDLKDEALATLRGKWGSFVGLTFIYLLLVGIASGATQFGEIFTGSSFSTLAMIMTSSGVLLTILAIPMQFGYSVAHLHSSRQDLPADIGDLFFGYKRFWHVLGTMLLMTLAIIGGMILFVIPGIILAFAYAIVPLVLRDNPELSPVEVLQKSRMMMKGHKMDLFLLYLSFIGWAILCIFTFFIGYLWLAPYVQMTEVKFYEKIRAEFEGEEDESVEEEETSADVAE